MSENFADVKGMSGNWPFVTKLSGECHRKILSRKAVVLKKTKHVFTCVNSATYGITSF